MTVQGARLVVLAMVASQFVDVTLLTVGGFVVSAQKLAVLFVLPLAIVMMGSYRMPAALVSTAGAMIAALSVASLLGDMSVPGLSGYVTTVLLSVAAAGALVTALQTMGGSGADYFGKAWVFLAAASAVLTVAQFARLAPLVNVPQDMLTLRDVSGGYVRGSGLKYDPNFQAFVLVIGLIFARSLRARSARTLLLSTILAGIFCTLSRMGMILAVLVLIFGYGPNVGNLQKASRRLLQVFSGFLTVAVLGVVAYQFAPSGLRAYLAARVDDVLVAVTNLFTGSLASEHSASSGIERGDLFRGTVDIAVANPVVGVGAGQVPTKLAQSIGVDNAAHNTYLELWAVGGVFGILVIVLYAWGVLGALRRGRWITSGGGAELKTAHTLMASFAVASFFITFIYNSLFWIPLAFCLGLTPHVARKASAASDSRARGVRTSGLAKRDLLDGRLTALGARRLR